MAQQYLTSEQFLGTFLSKYPQYESVDRDVLLPAILEKYPQYKSVISDFSSSPIQEDTLDFSRIESLEERIDRNRRQMPDMMNEDHLKDVGMFGKFFEGVVGGLSLGRLDEKLGYTEADDVGEMLAQGVGELAGAIPSFMAASAFTGGVGAIPASARSAQTLNRVRKLVMASDRMRKAGDTAKANKTMRVAEMAFDQAKKAGVPYKSGWKANLAAEKIGYGALGRSQWYKGKILDLAANNKGKAAKLLQLASNNLGTFALHGQGHLPINASIEDRFKNLGSSAAGASVFSVAGVPKIYFPSSKAAKVLETPALFAAGMYSDMGMDSEMTLQDRFVHGASLAIFHNVRKGVGEYRNRQNIKSTLINQYGVSSDQANRIAFSRGVDNILKAAMKKVKEDGTNVYYKIGDAAKQPSVYFVGPRKIAERNWKPVYRDLTTGKEYVGFGKENYTTAQRAVGGFKTRYKEMEVDLAERQGPPEPPPQETLELVNTFKKRKRKLSDATDSNRTYTEPIKEDVSGSYEKVIDPQKHIKLKRGAETARSEFNHWKQRKQWAIEELNELTSRYTTDVVKARNPERAKREHSIEVDKVKKRFDRASRRMDRAQKQINETASERVEVVEDLLNIGSPESVKIVSGVGKAKPSWAKNSLVNIPFFKNTAEGFDYGRAGVGRFVEKLDKKLLYETESQVIHRQLTDKILNEQAGKPYGDKVAYRPWDRPVFEVRTNGGSKKNYVVFDGRPGEHFLEAVRNAKEKGRSLELDRVEQLDPNSPNYSNKIKAAERNIEKLKRFDMNDFPMLDVKRGNWRQKQESLDMETYQNWETTNPKAANPWSIKLQYDKIDTKGRTYPSKAVAPAENGKPIKFATKEAAEAWAQKNWVQSDGLLKQISEINNQLDFYEGTSFSKWKESRGRVHGGRERAGMTKIDMKNMLDIVFPQAKGQLDNLNLAEMRAFERLVDPASQGNLFNENMSVYIPPNKNEFLNTKMARFWNGVRKLTLPFYSVLSWSRGKAGLEIADRSLKTHLDRLDIAGPLTTYQKNLQKQHNLNRKQHEGISSVVDEALFGSFYDKSLDKIDRGAIRKAHEGFMDEALAKAVESGMKVKNAKNGKWERFFRAYDSKGRKINPLVPQDAMRIIRGYEYLDNTGRRAMQQEDTFYSKEHKVRLPEESYVREHLSPYYDNVWVIRGKNRYVPTLMAESGIKWRKLNNNQIDILNKNGEIVRNVDIYNKKSDGSVINAKGKPNNHIPVPYLPRIVTREFRKYAGLDTNFIDRMAEHMVRTVPEYRKMDPFQAKELARENIERQKSYWDETGMYGAQWSRIIDLPPMLGFDSAGNIISTKGNSVLDVNGNIMSKGSKVLDINGNKVTVDKTIDVYERNYDTIMSTYTSRLAHQASVHKNFPMAEGDTRAGVESSTAKSLIAKLRRETSEDFGNWAAEGLKNQLNGSSHIKFENQVRSWTAFSSHIGLSSPLSGIKNIMLGQAANVNTFTLRGTMHTWANLLSGGFGDAKRMAEMLGQTEAGVHELYSGKGPLGKNWSTYNPGLMRPTELFNRYTGVVLGRTALEMHVNNLHGVKNMMNKGVSLSMSMNTLREAFKFTGKEIEQLMKFKPSEVMNELNPKTEFYRKRAMQQGSLFTQGGPDLPMIPKWMGHRIAKPLTLFYRIAYRVTDAVAKTVMKPAIVDGNPFPLLRYATLATGTGAGIYSLYYYALGEDRMNKFKKAPFKYWDMFIRGEGLGVMSNAFDSYGGITDTYTPVIIRNAESTLRETVNILTGKKPLKTGQGVKDWLKENVVVVNHTMEALERGNKAINNRVQHSKRRQRQFAEEYLNEEAFQGDADDLLTTRSPHYRMIRESFWSDDEDAKAKAYYAALQFVGHDFFRKAPALLNNPTRAEKKARDILKSIVNKQKPIPDSWRKRQLGKKSKKELYFELLDAETIQEEKNLEREFFKRKNAWNAAISRYRKKYYRNIYGEVR